MSDPKEIVRATIKELQDSGDLLKKSELYVNPETHKEHHDWLDDVMPWAKDAGKIIRKRVISAFFLLIVTGFIVLAYLATDLKDLIPPKLK